MKKFLSILTVIATVLTLFSCQKAEEPNKTVKKYDRAEQVSENFLEFTTAESETNTDLTENNQTQPATNPVDSQALRNKYDNFIYYNDRYRTFNGVESTFTPIKNYIDLDGDSVDELVYFIQFNSDENYVQNFGYFFIFDYINGSVHEVYSCETIGLSRMTDHIRIYKENGQYYISKAWNDGNYSQLGAVYTYNGSKLAPEFSINGMYNDPAFYNISYGEDVFLYDLENVEVISEDEFRRIQDELYTRGETVFYTSDAFI